MRLVGAVFADSQADGSVVLAADGERAAKIRVLMFAPDVANGNRLRCA